MKNSNSGNEKSPLLVPEHFAHAVIIPPAENVIEGHNILYFLLSCKVTMVYGPGEWTGSVLPGTGVQSLPAHTLSFFIGYEVKSR